MKLLFVGLQGSGKGTQAKIISAKLKLKHISTGDLLRNTKGKLKQEIDKYIKKGKLIPDKLMLKILKQKLPRDNFILDGFPRNIKQARMLDKIIKIDYVVDIEISDNTARKRLRGRWNCRRCGLAYNVITSPKPKRLGICDICGGKLFQREDDINEEAVNKRLKIYHKETEPILQHYKAIKINGEKSIKEVAQEILKKLPSNLLINKRKK